MCVPIRPAVRAAGASTTRTACAGAGSSLSNAVSGTTTGSLELGQKAIGGAGGSGGGAIGGAGGTAVSQLSLSDATSGSLIANSYALGGAGGAGTSTGAGGAGDASVSVTGANATTANATAMGGSSGGAGAHGYATATAKTMSSGAGTSGTGATASAAANAIGGAGETLGVANADALAETPNGQLAQATGVAAGGGGHARSTALAPGTGTVRSVTALSAAPVGETATVVSQADAASTFGYDAAAHDAYAFATMMPDAGSVGALLAASPNVDLVLGGGGPGEQIFGAGVQGAHYVDDDGGARTLHSEITFTVDATTFSGHLIAGLVGLDNALPATGFAAFDFSVAIAGTTVLSHNSSIIEEAQDYFHDHVIDLGPVAPVTDLSITFSLDVTSLHPTMGWGMAWGKALHLAPAPPRQVRSRSRRTRRARPKVMPDPFRSLSR